MPYPERLDPREVLAHLNQLGYQNITSHQLKDFIHDLKKLIKHEQRLNDEADKENVTNESNFSVNDSCNKKKETKVIYLENESISTSPGSSDMSDASSTITECSCLSGSTQVKRYSCFGSQDSKGTKVQRPQSSFIRPWRLHPSDKVFSGNSLQKTDPVKLYHKYKEIWAQQKAPGENNHSQLRWTIREKMLGQDPHPHPRPMSSASSDTRRRANHI